MLYFDLIYNIFKNNIHFFILLLVINENNTPNIFFPSKKNKNIRTN